MSPKSKLIIFVLLMLAPPMIFFGMDYFFELNYLSSSLYKVVFLFPLIYRLWIEKASIKDAFNQGFSFASFKKNFFKSLFLGLILASIYLVTFFTLSQFIDFQSIVQGLKSKADIDVSNILFIGLYIILINSLLEEFFWRGFLFDEMSKIMRPWLASGFTGVAFAFHHLMFYYAWFTTPVFLLVSAGLAGFAIIINMVFSRYQDLFSCWFIHMFADIAQIYIALRVFELL